MHIIVVGIHRLSGTLIFCVCAGRGSLKNYIRNKNKVPRVSDYPILET